MLQRLIQGCILTPAIVLLFQQLVSYTEPAWLAGSKTYSPPHKRIQHFLLAKQRC